MVGTTAGVAIGAGVTPGVELGTTDVTVTVGPVMVGELPFGAIAVKVTVQVPAGRVELPL